MMKKLYLILISAIIGITSLQAQTMSSEQDAKYAQEVTKMLELTNMPETFNKSIVLTLRANFSQKFTEEQIIGIAKDCTNSLTPFMAEKMVEVCKKYYTLEDMKNMNAFYTTPTGKKVAAAAAGVSTDMMQLMQAPEAQQLIQPIIMKYLQ